MRKIRSGAIDAATALVVALVFAILFHPARVRAAKRTGPAAATAAKAPVASDPAFGTYWHDGKAELDGYRYTVTRYGRERRGHAVAVYVTEPFSRSLRVKVDDPSRNPKDTFDVLKLNLIRDFQTGIYDYNTMTSLFVRSEDFEPVKVSFVSTEWCGNVYEELLVNPGLVSQKLSSYFEGESVAREERRPKEGILEEELFLLLRGLNRPYLAPGDSRTVPFLPGSFRRRLTHQALQWTRARIERLAAPRTLAVPAGSFHVVVFSVRIENGAQGTFFVESSYPHRIVRWEWNPLVGSGRWGADSNDSGELSGSARLKYWELHDEGGERYLARLGLNAGSR